MVYCMNHWLVCVLAIGWYIYESLTRSSPSNWAVYYIIHWLVRVQAIGWCIYESSSHLSPGYWVVYCMNHRLVWVQQGCVLGQFILKSVFLLLVWDWKITFGLFVPPLDSSLCIFYTFRSESCSKKCCEEFLFAGVIKYQKSVRNTGIYLVTDLYLLVLPSCCW